MLKRIKEFLAKQLKNPKKLMSILHSSEAESGFKWVLAVIKSRDSDTMLFLTTCILFVTVLVIFGAFVACFI